MLELDQLAVRVDLVLEDKERVDRVARLEHLDRVADTTGDALAAAVKAYAKKHLASDARRSADEAVAQITTRISKRKSVLPSLIEWFEKNNI